FLSVEWNEKVDLIQRGVGDYAIWGNGRDQRRRKAGCHLTCSAEGIGRRKRVVLLNREIESVLVIREGGVNADPVAAANNGLFIERIGKSKSRREFFVVGLPAHVGRNLPDARQFQTVISRVVVRKPAGMHGSRSEKDLVPQSEVQSQLLRYRPLVLNVGEQSLLPHGRKGS